MPKMIQCYFPNKGKRNIPIQDWFIYCENLNEILIEPERFNTAFNSMQVDGFDSFTSTYKADVVAAKELVEQELGLYCEVREIEKSVYVLQVSGAMIHVWDLEKGTAVGPGTSFVYAFYAQNWISVNDVQQAMCELKKTFN